VRALDAGHGDEAGGDADTGGVSTGADEDGGSGAAIGAGEDKPEGRVSNGRDSMFAGRSGADSTAAGSDGRGGAANACGVCETIGAGIDVAGVGGRVVLTPDGEVRD
jgi:hypothetical protein